MQTLRHTRSLPASFPTTFSLRQKKQAITGIATGPPTKPTAHWHTPRRPEGAVLGPHGNADTGVPAYGIPMQRTGWGASGPRTQTSPWERSVPSTRTTHGSRIGVRAAREPRTYPAIVLTLAVASEGGHRSVSVEGDDETVAYPFRPPGLSVPARAPTSESQSFPTPADSDALPNTAGTRRSASPHGAPLLHSMSHLGEHHHFPGLDHGRGGIGDEDALIDDIRVGPATARSRS